VKYFTPERLVQLQDRANRETFLAALEDWESALQAYQEHLGRIREILPLALRRLLRSASFHDAEVIDVWPPKPKGQPGRFTIILQPESDPARRIVLRYSLEDSPRINKTALPEIARSRPMAWLYDELDVEPPVGEEHSVGTEGRIFTHDILFSNGWEVGLRFRKVTVERPPSLISAGAGSSGRSTETRSA
jgi:hypothetical protein